MRAMRIWQLGALVLSVPLLAAALPPGCYGGLNPSFVQAIGGNGASAGGMAKGYHVLGIFNRTAYFGQLDVTITGSGASWQTGWAIGFAGLTPRALAWKCDLQDIEFLGGTLWVPDAAGVLQQTAIQFTGPILTLGNQLQCGLLIKASIVPVINQGGILTVVLDPFATPTTVQNLEYHIFIDLLADETDTTSVP